MMPGSIRGRLLLVLSVLLVTSCIGAGVLTYLDARHEFYELFDAQMAEAGRLLLHQSRVEKLEEHFDSTHENDDSDDLDDHLDEHIGGSAAAFQRWDKHRRYEHGLFFQIWNNKGRLLYSSSSRLPKNKPVSLESGYADVELADVRWRFFADWDSKGERQVWVGAPVSTRDRLAQFAAVRLLMPSLAGIPVLLFLVWFWVGKGLAPLSSFAREISNRDPRHLGPVALPQSSMPTELRPVVDSMNDLLSRLSRALEGARRFTADAAHELRTPLAGIRAQAQVALKSSDACEREQALKQLITGVDRATRLAQQLLTLERIDAESVRAQPEKVDLREEAREVLAALSPQAMEKRLSIELQSQGDVCVQGKRGLLSILLRNLVENAIRYSPAGGEVRVEVAKQDGHVVARVIDTGPGISEQEQERVFDRFYRVTGAGGDGSGLGLSIVRRIVEVHQARITLKNRPDRSGLEVQVEF